jgi:hypothetical protein
MNAHAGLALQSAISTFNTDYLFVKADNLERAIDILQRQGHTIQ